MHACFHQQNERFIYSPNVQQVFLGVCRHVLRISLYTAHNTGSFVKPEPAPIQLMIHASLPFLIDE